ncbi:hypothetical protein [Microbispora triticiradicis]|uniref:hypothetical protein n=1 Tax=Microbispora triticiradicis TaxID=2200763 RepID=UPI001AD71719|nr:hypothetical protein [Microbispora triticiradicis]MBO4269260.1 hypothetical protein [Microbispora triticiradicis]
MIHEPPHAAQYGDDGSVDAAPSDVGAAWIERDVPGGSSEAIAALMRRLRRVQRADAAFRVPISSGTWLAREYPVSVSPPSMVQVFHWRNE